MNELRELDEFTAEVLRLYLVSTVREMVVTTVRTAYSTCFAEGEDFTCGLFDAAGKMVAQDQGVAVHTGGLQDAVGHIIEMAGPIEEGDVFIHNDPYRGGTHQADVLVCRPMFGQGELLGFAANRGHWSDIGGMAAGGWSGGAEDVIQEGLTIPAMRLMRRGVVDEDLRALLLSNARLPRQLWGDLQAQVASTIVAERRVQEVVERYGLPGYRSAIEAAISYSRKRFLAALETLPNGTGEGHSFMEDDGRANGPFPIQVRMTKTPDGFIADFEGTSSQVLAPINCSLACTKAAVIVSVLAVSDHEIPLNAGLIDAIEIRAPVGSMVNPDYPAPVFASTADGTDRVAEAVLKALAQLAPDRVPAGYYWTGNNVTGSGIAEDGREFLWYSYQSGGCGARPTLDGNAAEWHLMANSKNESMEVWETRYPVEFVSYELAPDSGGAGEHRGGLGTERRFRMLSNTRISGISDHHFTGSHGVDGGLDGVPNGFFVERGGQRLPLQEMFDLRSPSKFWNLPLQRGDVFVSVQGGGGGFGDPHRRSQESVNADLREGYISPGGAKTLYGVSAAAPEKHT
jgi:N-methylhydantoinase B